MVDNGNIIKKYIFREKFCQYHLLQVKEKLFNCNNNYTRICYFGGIGLSWNILWYFLILAIQFIVSIGISLLVSSLTVYFRDLLHLLGVFMQLLFYATPIVYSMNAVPANFRWLLRLNPMSYLIDGYRSIFYSKTMPDFRGLLIAFIMGIVLCIVGYFVFKKLEKRFAEEL